MAKTNTPKHLLKDSETFQAVCTKGDFFGTNRDTRKEALLDAAAHNSKPKSKNHVVNIIRTTIAVKAVEKNS